MEGALRSVFSFSDLGTPTFVLRDGDSGYIAQFRHRIGEPNAHIVFIAPGVDQTDMPHGEEAWARLIQAMIVGAGRRGAFTLTAEVSEDNDACMLLRRAGFASYVRQVIWQRLPQPIPDSPRLLCPATELDAVSISSLYYQSVPHIVRQVEGMPDPRHGWVLERDGRIMAYVTSQKGNFGAYVTLLIHPEVGIELAEDVIAAAVALIPRADKLPVYLCLRRYQEWLFTAAEQCGFTPYAAQAVMGKHIARRIEDCVSRPVKPLEVAGLRLPKIAEFVPIQRDWRQRGA